MRQATLMIWITMGALVGCRTTEEAGTKTVAEPRGLDPVMQFAKTDEQAMYLKMVGVEHENGIDVPKDVLHSTEGVFECKKDGVLESCGLRVRLKERSLSAAQPLTNEQSEAVWRFVRDARPEIKDERVVLMDLVCDYIGKKSPPFNVEDVTCKARGARLVSEAVFGEPVAEEIAMALRGESSLGNETVTLNGAVSCRFVEGSARTPCTVRAVSSGVLTEKVVELSAKSAAPVARRLMQATLDQAGVTQESAPKELMASLTCVVDNSTVASDGVRRHVCRARI